MNTYYLYYPDGGSIDIGHAMKEGFESAFVVTVKPKGLAAALKELAELAGRLGKKRRLEIHCHGLPGELILGSQGAVTNHNVRAFGMALREALYPGSLIEVLACLVASQGNLDKLLAARPAQIEGYREDYHGVIRQRKTRDYYGGKPNDPYQHLPLYNNQFTERKDPIKDNPNVFYTVRFEKDGLKFCLELAASSGCIVRAAYIPQYEGGGREVLDSPIGDWECEVFDFHPHGAIKFLGSSPYRGLMMNSFDMDQFPQA
ncbi:MAG: hypothetical protein H7Y30_16850 [Pyrinomonadaceae bacterium]|nr:hypothetical protein [Pyrinomonadaceae bacterium]